LRSTVTYCQS